jgi:hypothetical protein
MGFLELILYEIFIQEKDKFKLSNKELGQSFLSVYHSKNAIIVNGYLLEAKPEEARKIINRSVLERIKKVF